MKIILIGFMGSGKSSIGKSLSKKLKLPFIDMDEKILKISGRNNINEIFELDGELRFRELEIEAAKKLKEIENAIITTGGGAVMNKIIIDYLKNKGRNIIVFLDTKFETIKNRLNKNYDRPLFTDMKEAKKIFGIRQPLYRAFADKVCKTDNKSIAGLTQEIIKKIGNL